MHNESRVVYSRCQLAASWANKRERERKTDGHREKVQNLWVWNDEEIRTDQLEDKAKQQAVSSSAPCILYLSLWSVHNVLTYAPFSVFLPFSCFCPQAQCTPSSSKLTCLWCCLTCKLSLFSTTTWCSSMFSSHSVSESVSPPTPAVGDQPLSCQMMLRVALPLSSLFHPTLPFFPLFPSSHTCMHLTGFPILRSAQMLPSLYFMLSMSMSPLCSLSISSSHLFSWSVYDRESCPSMLWVMLCLAFTSASQLVNNIFCSFKRTKNMPGQDTGLEAVF